MSGGEGRDCTEDGGRPGGPEGDHWYKYRDGIMRNGLCVMSYNLADAPAGAGGFACIPGSHKSNFLREFRQKFDDLNVPHTTLPNPLWKQEMYYSSPRHSFTGQCRGQPDTNADALLYKYSPGHSSWAGSYYDISKYEGLTQQKRMLLPPSIGSRPRVIEEN